MAWGTLNKTSKPQSKIQQDKAAAAAAGESLQPKQIQPQKQQ